MSTARTAKASNATPVTWSNGDLFDGYLLIGIATPSGRPGVAVAGYDGVVEPPIFTVIPITAGEYNQATPPNTKYYAWLYDKTNTQVGSISSVFTITSTPFTPPSFTTTVPSAGSAPTPNF